MIISASRRTDIPAFYSEWFMNRLRAEEVLVPHVRSADRYSYVSLAPDLIDGIAFWTKNPKPMFPYLPELKQMGYPFYFQFTLTPYSKDFEPFLPSKKELIATFVELSDQIGKERIVWRYDPIFLSPRFSVDYHVECFGKMSEVLKGSTQKVIFSFLDLYASTKRKMKNIPYQVLSESQQDELVRQMAVIAQSAGFTLSTCSEDRDFSQYGVTGASCVDINILNQISSVPLIGKKDKNQRESCGCIESIDIGCYDSCGHGCYYCYANHKNDIAERVCQHDPLTPSLKGWPNGRTKITERAVNSIRQQTIELF